MSIYLEGERDLKTRPSRIVDLVLRTVALIMALGAVVLLAMQLITLENAVIMLGIGMSALVFDRLKDV